MPRVRRRHRRKCIGNLRQRLPLTAQGRVNRGGGGWVEVAESPWLGLRVVSVEVRDQLVVGKVPQAGAVIRHAIGLAREVETPLLVVEHTLMHSLEP